MMLEEATSEAVSVGRTGDQWIGWAALFELASMGLLPIGDELARALSSGEYADACVEAAEIAGLDGFDASGLEAYRDADPDDVFHELRRERTRLIVGERRPLITPYIGVWHAQQRGQRGQLMIGAESMAIERYMRRCGVAKDLAAGQTNDPVDHVGTVCEFMQYLCLVAAQAVAAPAGTSVSVGDAKEFFAKHFSEYAKWFAGRLLGETSNPYYRFVSQVMSCFESGFSR